MLEEKIIINDFGIIDEALIAPVVTDIISQYFPIYLLSDFKINCPRIKEIENETALGRKINISESTLNSLKRLSIIKSNIDIRRTNDRAQIRLFDEQLNNNQRIESYPLLYDEALNILEKVLKLSEKEIFEALWKGCHPSLKLVVPYVSNEEE